MPLHMYKINIILLILFVLYICFGCRRTLNRTDIKNEYAVVIGIADYENVADLEFADKDARAFASFLNSKSGGSINMENIKIFINEEATSNNIGDAFTWLLNTTNSGDRVYIFYAGHGDVESIESLDNGLLLLHKAPKESYLAYGYDYLPIAVLKKLVLGLTTKETEIIVITDACHSGNLAGGETGIYSTSLQLMDQWSNSIKILSCKPNELSYEGPQWGDGHGVFSYYLVLGMGGLADKNMDRTVTLSELEAYLEFEVTQQISPSYQTPFTIGNKKRIITTIDSIEYIEARIAHENQVKTFSYVNALSSDEIFFDYLQGQDDTIQYYYRKYNKFVEIGNLIEPEDSSAYLYFKNLQTEINNETLLRLLERNFSAALQDKAMEIIVPILNLEKISIPVVKCDLAASELKLARELLGKEHYMYNSITTRKLFLEAYSLSENFKDNKDTSFLVVAENKLDSAIIIDPNAAYCYFQLGWIYNIRGDFTKALIINQKYTSLVPNNHRAYNNLGYAYNALEQYDSAIIQFNKVVELDSNFAQAYNNIGFAYALQGKFEESERWFKIAITKDSAYQQAYYNLGLVYKFLNNYHEAERYLLKAIELNSEDYDSYYYLACVYSLTDNLNKALFCVEKAIGLGFKDQDQLMADPDLENIRHLKEFLNLQKAIK